MNRSSLLSAAGFALATTLAAPVFASDTILFDPDGTGGLAAVPIGAFDWAVNSSLLHNAIPITSTPTDVDVYTHAALQGFQDTNGDPLGAPAGLNSTFEITFISAQTESITSITDLTNTPTSCSAGAPGQSCTVLGNITLTASANPNINVFEIYYDDLTDGSGLQSSALSGLGYADGQLILTASLNELDGTFQTVVTFTDVDGDNMFDPNVDTVTSNTLLDSFGTDQWGGQLTLAGQGGTDLTAKVLTQDNDFFITALDQLVAALFFNTSNIIPYNETNPSNSFDDGAGGTISTGAGTLDVGNINGWDGPDLLLQTDANTSFKAAVPEPNTVLLFALGLLFLGSLSRGRYLKKS